MKKIVLFVLKFYKVWVSPNLVLNLGHSCRFEPTCSEYAYQAVQRYGVVKGIFLSAKRIAKCNPLSKPGPDPLVEIS